MQNIAGFLSHPDFVCENLSLKKKRKCGIKVGDIISNVFNQPTQDQCPFDGGFVNHDDDDDDAVFNQRTRDQCSVDREFVIYIPS